MQPNLKYFSTLPRRRCVTNIWAQLSKFFCCWHQILADSQSDSFSFITTLAMLSDIYTISWEEILLHLIVTITRFSPLIDTSGSLHIAAQPQLRLWHADFEHRLLESLFIPRIFHISVHRLAVHIWIYLGMQSLLSFTFFCVWTDESTVLYTSGVQLDINLWV